MTFKSRTISTFLRTASSVPSDALIVKIISSDGSITINYKEGVLDLPVNKKEGEKNVNS